MPSLVVSWWLGKDNAARAALLCLDYDSCTDRNEGEYDGSHLGPQDEIGRLHRLLKVLDSATLAGIDR